MTDITCIRTLEGFACLAVVIDLYSRRVIGWSMQSRQTTDLVLQALLMAVWHRKPTNTVPLGSGSAVHEHGLGVIPENSQSSALDEPPCNCHDNAVVESFFNLLKRERIRRRTTRHATKPGRMCRLHRDVLQPSTQACKEPDAVARQVRTAAKHEHKGRLENSELFI